MDVRGIEAVLKYTGIPKCVIGIENNKPECIELLNQKTKDKPAIEVKALPSVYGTGAELILIEKCLGREVPHGGLPADAGAIVMNDSCFYPGQVPGYRYAGGRAHHHRGRRCSRKAPEPDRSRGTAYEDVLERCRPQGRRELGKVEPRRCHDGAPLWRT